VAAKARNAVLFRPSPELAMTVFEDLSNRTNPRMSLVERSPHCFGWATTAATRREPADATSEIALAGTQLGLRLPAGRVIPLDRLRNQTAYLWHVSCPTSGRDRCRE
jgi:hypothetical protein